MPVTLGSLIVAKGAPAVVENKEQIAGSYAFIPGFSPQPISAEGDLPRDGLVTFSLDPASTSDLRQSSLRALEEYTRTRLAQNAYHPGSLPTDPSGHRANEALKPIVEDDNASVYLPGSDPMGYDQPGSKTSEGQITEFVHSVQTSAQNPAPVFLFNSQELKDHKGPAENFDNSESSFGVKTESIDPNFDPKLLPENLTQYTDYLLDSHNRYDPGSDSPFLRPEGSGQVGENRMKGLFSLQSGNLGKFDPNAPGVTTNDMRAAAIEALLRAQTIDGDFGGGLAGRIAKDAAGIGDGSFGRLDLLFLVPHPSQLGYGTAAIDQMRIRSTEAMSKFGLAKGADDLLALKSFQTWMGFGNPDDDYLKAKGDRVRFGTSFGTLNSPMEKFGNPTPFGMILPIIFSFIAFGLLSIVIGGLMSLTVDGDQSRATKNPEDPDSYTFGANYPSAAGTIGQKLLRMYNLPRVVADDFFSTLRGLCVFYGINHSPIDPTATPVFDGFLNILLSPGYYTTISKQVLRDFTKIADAMLEFEKLGNLPSAFSTISMVFGLLDAMFNSLFVRFFFTMSHYGALWEMSKTPGSAAHGGGVIPLTMQQYETRMSPEIRGKISRFSGNGQAVGSTSLLLYNSYLIATSDSPGPIKFKAKAPNILAGPRISTNTTLSPEQVKRVESLIDREYMPFSIQDLRTNEVISLPAFINQVSEDFNVEYTQSHGFGRTDPVYSYAKAARMITLNFTLFAQNKNDHDYMWYIINKIVSMCYPQRNTGHQRKLNDQNFIQPFSQTPTASPVIRIRLGELLHSNASDTAFAKIFGGQDIINATDVIPAPSSPVSANKAITTAKEITNNGMESAFVLPSTSGNSDDDSATFITGLEFMLKKGATYKVRDPDTNDKKPTLYDTKMEYSKLATVTGLSKITIKGKNQPKETDSNKSEGDIAKFAYYWRVDVEYEDEIEAFAHGKDPARFAYNKGQPVIPLPFGPGAKPVTYFIPAKADEAVGLVKIDQATALAKIQADEFTVDELVSATTGLYGTDETYTTEEAATVASETATMTAAFEAAKKIDAETAGDNVEYPKFLSPDSNPIRKAFKSAGGSGLAGVITNLSFDYAQFPWGTTSEFGKEDDDYPIRAPKGVNINMSFAPIHDLPLGLNHNGEMFAPSHPTGILSAAANKGYSRKKEQEIADRDTSLEQDKQRAIEAVPLPLAEQKDPGKPSFF